MPTYDYKCKSCGESYVEVHSISGSSKGCPYCNSEEIELQISLFAAKTENSFDKALTIYEKQGRKDLERFATDDTFAANVTGADDPNHHKKLQKVLRDQAKKNDEARKKIKRKQQ